MVVHTGLLYEGAIRVDEEVQPFYSPVPEFPDLAILLSAMAAGIRAVTATASGALADEMTFAAGPLLNRVYFLPRIVDGGFIVQDTEQDITIWNAHESQSYTISAITDSQPDGTTLDHPATPITITPETNLFHLLTLLRAGPPFQDTTYTYNIAPWSFVLTIQGRRIEAFLYDPDWRSPFKVGYSFLTILARSKRFVEQRRALYEKVKRKLEAAFWFNGLEMQQFSYDLRRFHAKVLGVPIFSEPMHPTTSPLQGSTFTIVSEDIVDYWNLRNATKFVLFKDLEDKTINEVKEITSLDTGIRKLTFTNQIAAIFVQAQTVIYPVCLSLIGEVSPRFLTDDLAQVELSFEEFKSG